MRAPYERAPAAGNGRGAGNGGQRFRAQVASTGAPHQAGIAAHNRQALAAFRLIAGTLKGDAERLVWVAYEIAKCAEVAGLISLRNEAMDIAVRAHDAGEVLQ